MDNNLVTAAIFLVLGIVALFIFFYFGKKRKRLLSTGMRAEGTVFDFVADSKSSSPSRGYPVIRFLTTEQEWITQVYNVSYPGFILKREQKVEVFYDPHKPTDFILNLKAGRRILFICLGIGLIMIRLSLCLIIPVITRCCWNTSRLIRRGV